MTEYSYRDYGDLEEISQEVLDDIEDSEIQRLNERSPLTGGVILDKSSCCHVPVVQSEGAHDIGNGMYVGGVIMEYCPKCHKPYHDPIIGSS